MEDGVGVAIEDAHVLRRKAQQVTRELTVHGLVTLSVRMRPRQNGNVYPRIEANLDCFLERNSAGPPAISMTLARPAP